MSKRVLAIGFALMLMVFVTGNVSAQFPNPHPFIGVYFDSGCSVDAFPLPPDPCPGVGVLDTLYICLVNANAFVLAVEFSVSYCPALTWLADLDTPPTTFGTTPTGISIGFGSTPKNGFSPISVCKVLVQWNCGPCDWYPDCPIVVDKHPASVRAYPSYVDLYFVEYDTIGLTSIVCPMTIATEESTWGKVKALYIE
ncbi:MAG: hypothetical protein JSW58_07140 [Candidatus Latescibacterota bacterium]|nr:MAG: hypothetical protein JSW58_07140 [Candidatus Latescibacterota bacterium]